MPGIKYRRKMDSEIIGKLNFLEQVNAAEREKGHYSLNSNRLLIIHTGGTIGMFRDQHGKFRPEKDKFKSFLETYPYFSDAEETYFTARDDYTITPTTINKKQIWYKFKELDKLIDSTCMSIKLMNYLLSLLKAEYEKYDAFVILHGTDTMAYTASALSFMIDNLKKTVIITGAQVPMGETRNDAINNLLCAITVAGLYTIPEVLVVFDNKIFRGSRVSKCSASTFSSFDSANFLPIGTLGLKIEIRWELIQKSKVDKPTYFQPLSQEVGVLRLTPFGLSAEPTDNYLVVESYGVGNIPIEGQFYEWLKKNSQKSEDERTVIVNISQVYQSVIRNLYETGNVAQELGMIPGSDMTCEAAVAKLSYLASIGYKNLKELGAKMKENLRGELTEEEDRQMNRTQNYASKTMKLLDKKFKMQNECHQQILKHVVYPALCQQQLSLANINQMFEYDIDINYVYPNGRNLLHYYCRSKHIHHNGEIYLKVLLEKNINVNLVDQRGNSPIFYALEKRKYEDSKFLFERGAKVITTRERIFYAIREQDTVLLQTLIEFGDNLMNYRNEEDRNCAVYALLCGASKVLEFFADHTDLFTTNNLEQKDIYGKTVRLYVKEFGYMIPAKEEQI